MGRANAPLILDVRPPARFEASAKMLAGAQRCAPADLPKLIASLTGDRAKGKLQRDIVTYCVYGHHVGSDAAAALRAVGFNAKALAGGFEGGEDGVDNAKLIAEWRSTVLPSIAKEAP